MTIEYRGIRPSYEVTPSLTRKLYATMRPAHNNKDRVILQVEVVDHIHVEHTVNRSNMSTYHDFFTNENYGCNE